MSEEVLSGLKVLVAVAKADGVVHDNERLAIESALDTLDDDDDAIDPKKTKLSLDDLLALDVDLDAELKLIKSVEVKRQTFDSACALAYADGEASDVERVMLEKVRAAFELAGGDQAATSARVKHAFDRAFAPFAVGEDKFAKRDVAIDDEIRRFAVLSAALVSAGLPAFCEGIDVWNHVRMARKIGSFYGRGESADAQYWKTFVSNMVGSAKSWFAVSLFARLSSVSSRASNACASTFAIGQATKQYFEKSEAIASDDLRKAFIDAKKEAASLYGDLRAKIDEKKTEIETIKATLDTDLAAKKIDEGEYMQRLVVLD